MMKICGFWEHTIIFQIHQDQFVIEMWYCSDSVLLETLVYSNIFWSLFFSCSFCLVLQMFKTKEKEERLRTTYWRGCNPVGKLFWLGFWWCFFVVWPASSLIRSINSRITANGRRDVHCEDTKYLQIENNQLKELLKFTD